MSDMNTAIARRSIWTRLYHGETTFDFMKARRRWFTASALVIVAGLVSLGFNGLNLGIEFRGGTSWEVPAKGFSVTEARNALPAAMRDAKVQQLGSSTIRVQADPRGSTETKKGLVDDVTSRLANAAGITRSKISVNDVGPSWGNEITAKARRALIVFLVVITLYITFRFELKMAIATLVALVHDIAITIGVYSIFRLEVTPPTVVAVLTILGYSIYDGIVVFDKVEENTKTMAASGRMTYTEMVNTSLNQVLMRTLNTSLTALLPILSLLVIGAFILGASTLQEFAVALLVGLAAGAYSSIFIASPLLAILKEREPRYRAVRERLSRGVAGATGPRLVPGMALAGGDAAAATTEVSGPPLVPGHVRAPEATGSAAGAPSRPAITARPRKQRRRR
ncbi:MAG: protein translocase subunit SecF [Actinobacteria bacterium]|nr:protein translocase subunit SecF [Actinomycetota bacterium]